MARASATAFLLLTVAPVLCARALEAGDRGVCPDKYGTGEYECCNGYAWEYDEITEIEFCKPICRPNCGIHGECIEYNTCKCKPPYVLIEGKCQLPATCDRPCVNGKCVDYNKCACNEGYRFRNASFCEPECKSSCVNSTCSAPDVCDCFEGYTHKTKYECAPEWRECIRPNANGECTCNGYKREHDACIPICKGNCPYGRCTKPGECSCDAGYAHAMDKLTCHPVCENGCVNAKCVQPNQCSCLPGYRPTRNASVCEFTCDYCANGDCVGPNTCKCHRGYSMRGKKCKPDCSKTCDNGFCSEPDTCTCLPGYTIDDNDKFRCKPECKACEYGICTSPGLCSCNPGYESRNGTCAPICSQMCINGYCGAPNKCSCFEGYKMNSTVDSSVCFKPCLVPCDDGICSVNGKCLCPYEYDNATGCRTIYNETIDCKSCQGNCSDSTCRCPDGRPCDSPTEAPRTGLAGLELTWILAACVGTLLFIFVITIIAQMWRKRPHVKDTYNDGNRSGSVVFTAPGTLTSRTFTDYRVDEELYNGIDREYEDQDDNEENSERLLNGGVIYEDETL